MEQPWFRHYSGALFDPKFDLIAARAKAHPAIVRCAFFLMLELAAVAEDRGTVEGWDDEAMSIPLGTDPETLERIRYEMQGRLLDGDRVRAWEKRQPKREDNSAERTRRYRERKRAEAEGDPSPDDDPPPAQRKPSQPAATGNGSDVTVSDAGRRDVTHGDAEKRAVTLDEMRLDESKVRDDTHCVRIDTPSVPAVAGAAAVSPIPIIADVLWTACLPYLTSNGVSEKQARSMLGGWRKRYGAGEVAAAVAEAQRQAVSNPLPYVEATLRRRGEEAPRKNPFAPAVSNLEVARMFAEEEADRVRRASSSDPYRDGGEVARALPPAAAR